jgi:hypothetical protein
MITILCWIWPYVFGALLGWLGAGLLAHLLKQSPPTVERIVEVTRERTVDNPLHLERIRRLETEVATIAGLKSQIQTLQSAPPRTVEKTVERIVEVIMPDVAALDEKDREIANLRTTLTELDAELQRLVALHGGTQK